jgi:hypothetical protein
MFTGNDCLNFTTIKPFGVCVSGNGTDGTSYFTAADDAAGPFVISGGATNAGSTSSLPTLTQTAGVGVNAFPGTFSPRLTPSSGIPLLFPARQLEPWRR